jgi:hypothetical protein
VLDERTNDAALMEELRKMTEIGDPRMSDAMKATFQQSGSATTGLTYYDLEPGAKFLYPVLTPLRNMIPRISGKGGIQANWKAVTGINTSNVEVGVSEGNRGAVQAISTTDSNAVYKGIGLESSVTFEAQYAAQNWGDIRAIAGRTGLQATMIREERIILAGNGSLALGITPTPTAVGSTTGGALAAATYSVICVALTHAGLSSATIAGGIPTQITRTNADGSTDTYGGGSAQKSAAGSATTTGTTGSIAASVAAVRGAMGYAWFWGASGSEVLGAITTIPTVTITAAAAGTQNASVAASDNSVNNLVFDGLITQAFKSGSNAYWKDLGGATLTADGDAGIVEFDALLQSMWDNYRLSPDTVWCNAVDAKNIAKKILAGNANGAFRINVNMPADGLQGGIMVSGYLNSFGMDGAKVLNIRIHPNMPQGTILFLTSSLPYPMADVTNVFQMLCRQDYYQIEWPLRTRRYEYGVYADEVLQHYFPPSMGLLTGVKAG